MLALNFLPECNPYFCGLGVLVYIIFQNEKNLLHIAELKCTQRISDQNWGEWKRLFCFDLILFVYFSF